MKVLYLHGLGVDVGGAIPTFLRAQGLQVVEPRLPHGDFAAAVAMAREALEVDEPQLIVGYSRGGAVAMALDRPDPPIVLIAPAWRKWPSRCTLPPTTRILHSPDDSVIRFQDSLQLVQDHRLPRTALVAVGENHSMSDRAALAALGTVVKSHSVVPVLT